MRQIHTRISKSVAAHNAGHQTVNFDLFYNHLEDPVTRMGLWHLL